MDEQKDFHDSKADEIDHTFPGDDLLDPAHVDIEVPESKLHKIPNELSRNFFDDEERMEMGKSEIDHLLDTEGRQDGRRNTSDKLEGYYEDDVANQFTEEEFFDGEDDGFLAEGDEAGDELNDMDYDMQDLLNSAGLARSDGQSHSHASPDKKNRAKSRKKASVVWLFYKAHSRTHVECTVCHAHLNRSDGHSTKGMWSHLKKHPEKLNELKVGLPLSIDKNKPSPKIKRSNLGSARRKSKHPSRNKVLSTGDHSYEYLLPSNSKSVSKPNSATRMDVDEENAFDGEEGQQSDGNQGTDGGLRRGGRQRKKNPRFEEEDLIGMTSNRSSSSSRTPFGPPLVAYMRSASEEKMMEEESIPKSSIEKAIEKVQQKWAPTPPVRTPDSLSVAKTPKTKSQNTPPTYFVKTSNLPSNISTSPAVQQQKRISIPAQQQYTSTSLMADQNDSHHQKGSITVGQLLRAHREQSERIDVLLSENHKLTNALAESRRQNEILIRQNADIVKRLQDGNFFNGNVGDQKLMGDHQRAISSALQTTNAAAIILRERTNGPNSGVAGQKIVTAATENAAQTQQRQQQPHTQIVKRKLRESPATEKMSAQATDITMSSDGREIRTVAQEPPNQRRRASSNTPTATKGDKQQPKYMPPPALTPPIVTTEAEKARELVTIKESLKGLQFSDSIAKLIGDRRPKPYTPKEFGDWHSTTSTELRKSQSAELFRSICASSTIAGNRTNGENLDFAFHLENEAFNEATSREDYFERLAKRQQGFRESVSLLKFTGELPPSDSEDEEEEEGASDTPGREGSSEQKSSGVDGISVGDFLRGTVGKARERRQVGRPRRFD